MGPPLPASPESFPNNLKFILKVRLCNPQVKGHALSKYEGLFLIFIKPNSDVSGVLVPDLQGSGSEAGANVTAH